MLQIYRFIKPLFLLLFLMYAGRIVAQEPDPFNETPPDFEEVAPVVPLDTFKFVLLTAGVLLGMHCFKKINKMQATDFD